MAIIINGNGKTVYGPNIVTDGLILYLDAANTKSYVSGDTMWNDLSGNGNNGSLSDVTYSINYMSFNGNNSFVNCGVAPIFYPVNLSTFTLSIWANRQGNANIDTWGAGLISKGISSGWFINWFNNGSISFGAAVPGWTTIRYTNAILNTWVNLVGTYDGDSMKLYMNGALVDFNSGKGNLNGEPSTPLYIGSYYLTNFNGFLNCPSVYNRALSPSEILQNFNATKSRFKLS